MKTTLSAIALLSAAGFAAAQSTCTIPASAAVASGKPYTYEKEPCFPESGVCYPTNYYAAQDQGQFNNAASTFKKQLDDACRKTCDSQPQCLSYVGVLYKAADSNLATGTCFYYNVQQLYPRRCADAPSAIYAYYKKGSGSGGSTTTSSTTKPTTTPSTTKPNTTSSTTKPTTTSSTTRPNTTSSTTSTSAQTIATPQTCNSGIAQGPGLGGCPASCYCDSDVNTPGTAGYCTSTDFCSKQCSSDADCSSTQFCSPDFNDPTDPAQCGYNICLDYCGSAPAGKRSLFIRESSGYGTFAAMKRGLHPREKVEA